MMKNKEPLIRQIHLSGMNEAVSVLSSYEDENLDYLSKKALFLYNEIQLKKSEKNE